MINFLSAFVVSVLRFFLSIVRFVYVTVGGMVGVMLFFTVPFGGMLFLLLALNSKDGIFYFFLGMAIVIPALIYMIALAIINHVIKIKAHSSARLTYFKYQHDDESIYEPGQNLFSTQSLVDAEIPYTNEHLAKYGSMD